MTAKPSPSARTEHPPAAAPDPGPASALPRQYTRLLSGQFEGRDWAVRRSLAIADAFAISFAFIGSAMSVSAGWDPSDGWLLAVLAPLGIALFRAYGLYTIDLRRVGHGALDDIPAMFHALLLLTLLAWIVTMALEGDPVWKETLLFGGVALPLTLLLRGLARRGSYRHFGPQRTLLVGSEGDMMGLLARKLARNKRYRLSPVGYLSDDLREPMGRDLTHLGPIANCPIEDLVMQHHIEHVIGVEGAVDDAEMFQVLDRCRHLALKVSLLPQHVDAMGPSVIIGEIDGITVLNLNPLVLSRWSRGLKRGLDICGALTALIVLSPLLLAVAIAIRLDTRGPIFFRQLRLGQEGRTFRIIKFRTMVSNAEELRDDLLQRSADSEWLNLQGSDPRVTRVGRHLRVFSLDELPQLWNVLVGDMSLVGPRPLILEEAALVLGRDNIRLDLRPGITGLWQVLGRTDIGFGEMLKLDYVYVTNWSLWGDIKLLLRTLPAVVSRRGAN